MKSLIPMLIDFMLLQCLTRILQAALGFNKVRMPRLYILFLVLQKRIFICYIVLNQRCELYIPIARNK